MGGARICAALARAALAHGAPAARVTRLRHVCVALAGGAHAGGAYACVAWRAAHTGSRAISQARSESVLSLAPLGTSSRQHRSKSPKSGIVFNALDPGNKSLVSTESWLEFGQISVNFGPEVEETSLVPPNVRPETTRLGDVDRIWCDLHLRPFDVDRIAWPQNLGQLGRRWPKCDRIRQTWGDLEPAWTDSSQHISGFYQRFAISAEVRPENGRASMR